MDIPISNIVSATDIQRNYRKVFDRAKRTKKPVIVLRGNEPEVAVVDVKAFEEMEKRLAELEIENALQAVKEGEEEYKLGKTKTAKMK